jgi:hypothetical protein
MSVGFVQKGEIPERSSRDEMNDGKGRFMHTMEVRSTA